MFSYLWFISAYLELVVRKSTDSSSPLRDFVISMELKMSKKKLQVFLNTSSVLLWMAWRVHLGRERSQNVLGQNRKGNLFHQFIICR